MSVDLRLGGGPRFQPADPNIGEMAVKHSYVGGRLFVPVIGTSFAAPKISHIAASILREYPDASANLVRALLLLNATPPDNALALLETSVDSGNQSFYGYGYGRPNLEKTLYSLETCVTLVAEESIGADQTHFFEILLPQDFLSTGRCNRSIRVALAHSPPCRSTRKTYKGSKISFKVVAENAIETLSARFRAGSDLENIVEWGPLTPGNQLRSKGTAMKASKTIKLLPSTSPFLNCKRLFVVVAKDLVQDEEPYALTFAIEDRARNDIRLYAQLRAKLRQRVRTRV